SSEAPVLAALGFAGALFHVVNHALFKGTLFLGAGAVLHATGTAELDRLGGLARYLPWTAGALLVGAVAITGLPPCNGFAGEFLIYLGAFRGGIAPNRLVATPALTIIAGLALISGLAGACFAKAFGLVFLGTPRDESGMVPHSTGPLMRGPLLML